MAIQSTKVIALSKEFLSGPTMVRRIAHRPTNESPDLPMPTESAKMVALSEEKCPPPRGGAINGMVQGKLGPPRLAATRASGLSPPNPSLHLDKRPGWGSGNREVSVGHEATDGRGLLGACTRRNPPERRVAALRISAPSGLLPSLQPLRSRFALVGMPSYFADSSWKETELTGEHNSLGSSDYAEGTKRLNTVPCPLLLTRKRPLFLSTNSLTTDNPIP